MDWIAFNYVNCGLAVAQLYWKIIRTSLLLKFKSKLCKKLIQLNTPPKLQSIQFKNWARLEQTVLQRGQKDRQKT